MTRKDFRAIAALLAEARARIECPNEAWPDEAGDILDDIEGGLADLMQSKNPAFDRTRFHAACKPR